MDGRGKSLESLLDEIILQVSYRRFNLDEERIPCLRFTDFNWKPNNYNEKWEKREAQEHASKGAPSRGTQLKRRNGELLACHIGQLLEYHGGF